ncbi:MAG: pyridoxal phosphate-dependent class II aminotransferase [Deltaproteobacteria bacterium]|nr:pyridoxal phosphate-dependent class II aminotransferase [Deltaproteobacteria bacterium]MBW1961652.1 pyridoxal phosphate-dependent class II aminotransferase [Deltaproteobacteria bacterium]MBW1996213.1 pyridoxal phosphate-dependent class II aminotransferase [Deltaproteobacteria bacterium]MBW2153987.1 pyridoxal phosphate-dependent class II aminotransferase [Deltaproteobacteria bacterium]
MMVGHGGNVFRVAHQIGCSPCDIIDMSSNMNPLGPPEGLVSYLSQHIDRIHMLPEADARTSRAAFAKYHGISPERVLAGNGTTQFIYSLPYALDIQKALIVAPTYADYTDACRTYGVSIKYVISEESSDFKPNLTAIEDHLEGVDTVFICNPNNPTGALVTADELVEPVMKHPCIRWVIDESYLPFVEAGERESLVSHGLSNVIVLSSLSKIFRIPGLRIGFVVAAADMVQKIERYALPWTVNSLAQIAIEYLMSNRAEIDGFMRQTRDFLAAERRRFLKLVDHVSNIKWFPTTTSFMLAKLTGHHTSEHIYDYFVKNRILIRDCSNFEGLSNRFIRISLRSADINRKAARLLSAVLGKRQGARP